MAPYRGFQPFYSLLPCLGSWPGLQLQHGIKIQHGCPGTCRHVQMKTGRQGECWSRSFPTFLCPFKELSRESFPMTASYINQHLDTWLQLWRLRNVVLPRVCGRPQYHESLLIGNKEQASAHCHICDGCRNPKPSSTPGPEVLGALCSPGNVLLAKWSVSV